MKFFTMLKKGHPPKSLYDLDSLRNAFIDNGLFDLGYFGYDFTRCNYRHNGVVVEEWLDRFYANTNWSLLFPDAQVSHIDFDLSDHLPILLKCKPRGAIDCNRK